ncbi:TPA: fimbrial biogenesis chaperone [Enterobacter cancerogenus]
MPTFIRKMTGVIFALALGMCTPGVCFASVVLGATRLVYHEGDDSVTLRLSNRDKSPYLIQSWVTRAADADSAASAGAQETPFIVTPPLFRMNAGDSNELNIVKKSKALPEDRESVFYLNVKAIPGREVNSKSTLLIAVKSTLKLFYRPSALKDENVEKAWGQLTFSQKNTTLVVSNDSPCFITFYSLVADGTPVKIKGQEMIAPFAKHTYTVEGHSIHKVSWQVIGDRAEISPMFSGTLP